MLSLAVGIIVKIFICFCLISFILLPFCFIFRGFSRICLPIARFSLSVHWLIFGFIVGLIACVVVISV
jgi:hypothetical protein